MIKCREWNNGRLTLPERIFAWCEHNSPEKYREREFEGIMRAFTSGDGWCKFHENIRDAIEPVWYSQPTASESEYAMHRMLS
jgi:hypothetical protein